MHESTPEHLRLPSHGVLPPLGHLDTLVITLLHVITLFRELFQCCRPVPDAVSEHCQKPQDDQCKYPRNHPL